MAKPISVIIVGCLLSTGQLRWSKGLVIGNYLGHLLLIVSKADLLCLWKFILFNMYLFLSWIMKYHIFQPNEWNTLIMAFNFTPTCHPLQNNMLISHHHLTFPNSASVTLHYTKIIPQYFPLTQNLHLHKPYPNSSSVPFCLHLTPPVNHSTHCLHSQ